MGSQTACVNQESANRMICFTWAINHSLLQTLGLACLTDVSHRGKLYSISSSGPSLEAILLPQLYSPSRVRHLEESCLTPHLQSDWMNSPLRDKHTSISVEILGLRFSALPKLEPQRLCPSSSLQIHVPHPHRF